MHRVLAKHRVEFFDLHAIWSVLAILRRDVTRCTGHARIFVLCAFQNHLNAVSFLRHGFKNWVAKITNSIDQNNAFCTPAREEAFFSYNSSISEAFRFVESMAKNTLLQDDDSGTKESKPRSKRTKRTERAKQKPVKRIPLLTQLSTTWADERFRTVSGLLAMGTSLILALSIVSSMMTGNTDLRLLLNTGQADGLEGYHNLMGSIGAHIGYNLAREGLELVR